MILETPDKCESCAFACIYVSICHYKLLAQNNESALVKIMTEDKIFVMYMTKVHTRYC